MVRRLALVVALLASGLLAHLPAGRDGAGPGPSRLGSGPGPAAQFSPALLPEAVVSALHVALGAVLGAAPARAAVAGQQTDDQATLETQRPEVQWATGDGDWQAVPTQLTVHAGDRVRTGAGASARLVYFEGTTVELGPETGLRVERLARTDGGNVVTRLFQAAGSTVSRVVRLVDPSAGFEIDTPSATAFVRGTMPRVVVAPDGSTRVTNVPDGTEGLVVVIGKDQNTTQVTLRPGENTSVLPGLAPSLPGPAPSLALGGAEPAGPNLQEQQQERHQEEQERAQQQAEQARLGLIAAQNELLRLTDQENALIRQIADLLTPTPTPKASAGPSNASFAGATPITTLPARLTAITSNAATEPGESATVNCGGFQIPIGNTVWYTYTPAVTTQVVIDSAGSSFRPALAVYTGSTLASLTPVACNATGSGTTNLQPRLSFTAQAGTTYRIQVGGQGSASGNLVLNVTSGVPPPANDAFAAAVAVTTVPAQLTAVTDSASTEPGEPTVVNCAGFQRPIGNTVWYVFTPSATTAVSVDTLDSSFDTMLAVYTGSTLASLTQVVCNDDSTGTLQSRASFTAQAGTAYYVQIGGFLNAFGNLMVHFGPGVPPPPNDAFAAAIPVNALPAQLTATTDSATTEPGEPTSFACGGTPVTVSNTVWYAFTPAAATLVAVDTLGSGYDTVLAVYTGSAPASLTPLACNNDAVGTLQSRVVFAAAAGTTYRIQVGGASGSFGNLTIRFAVAPAPPANDNFAAAQVVTTLPAQLTATTDSATTEPGEPTTPSCAGFQVPVGNTVWYQFTPAANAVLTVDTFGSSFDTVLAVYTGAALGSLTPLTCNDNTNGSQSRVSLLVAAGTTYRVQVGGFQGAFGSLVVNFAAAPPPPANDNFAAAPAVATLPAQLTATTNSATTEPGEPTALVCAGTATPIGATVWYTFSPTGTTPLTIDTLGSSFDTVLAVYTGGALPLPTTPDVACNDDASPTITQSSVSFLAQAGTTYHVQVGGFQGAFGSLVVNFAVTPPPPNDNFAAAASVGALPATLTAVTLSATTELGEPTTVDAPCGPNAGTLGHTVWYTVTPAINTTVSVDTLGSSFDTVLAVYTGGALTGLTRVACNDDTPGAVQSQLSFAATAGTPYRIQAGGFGNAAGSLVVNVSSNPGPPPPAVARPSKLPPRPLPPGVPAKLAAPGPAGPAPTPVRRP